jgi:hypothetical protein
MDHTAFRAIALLNLVLPLLLFMAWVYLALHILFARVIPNRQSPVLWFFSVVTGPLTRPLRAALPAGTPEPRVRAIALVAYIGLWLVVRVLLALLLPAGLPG